MLVFGTVLIPNIQNLLGITKIEFIQHPSPHASDPFCILTFKEFEKIYCSMARDDIDVNLPGPSGAQMVPLQTCQFTILEGAGRSTLEVTHH